MHKIHIPISKTIVVAAMTCAASTLCSLGQGAMATISDTPVTGGFDYSILLQNTGTANLNSFWYGWTTSGNNLPSDPSTAANSLGWANDLSGNSIKWINSTGTALAPGNTASFTFFSADTPTAITTLPSGQSVAYEGGITFTENKPGDSTPVFSPTPTPEPSPVALLGAGALGLLLIGKRRKPTRVKFTVTPR